MASPGESLLQRAGALILQLNLELPTALMSTGAPKLILKRSPLADAGFEDYDVLSEGKHVGRIFKATAATLGRPWFWGIAHGHYRDPLPPHGFADTRAAAITAFRKAWVRQYSGLEVD